MVLSVPYGSVSWVRYANHRPRIVECEHCGHDVVWLETAYGGARLFNARAAPYHHTHRGNRFAIERASGLVVDLDNTVRRPGQCLELHSYECRETYLDGRYGVWHRDHIGGARLFG